jgi:hypothetical protein
MASSMDSPKVFISYCWKPVSNKQKTISLAERLENEGVHVIIDEWNLTEGQDKYQFMEQMVNNPEVKRVLIICNKEYADKANKKSGGVGIESLIISDEIYSQVEQTKFIPVIFERDTQGKEYVPTFVKSRIHIDLSNDEVFEGEYEKLMRNLFDKPASKRPPRGTPPAYILEEESIFLRTLHKVKAIQNALLNERKNSQVFVDDYYSTFIEALADFEINNEDLQPGQNIDDLVISRIDGMKLLRNDFVAFLEVILSYSTEFNLDKFISFLERMLEIIMKQESFKYPGRTIGELMGDQYKFFYNEFFLYMTAIMIDKEKFKELGQILNTGFVISNPRTSKTESHTFLLFNKYAESIDKVRNNRLNMRRRSLTADLLKQRSDLTKYTFDKLRECDVILYFIGIMQNETGNQWVWKRWFPQTTVYHIYQLPLLDKLISTRHFEKMKLLFNINTIAELKSKVDRVVQINADKIERFHYDFPYITQAFDFEKMGRFN